VELNASEELMDLAFFALDHGIDSVHAGGQLIAFAVIETDRGRELARFATERLEEGPAAARKRVANTEDAIRAAVVYDGYLTIEGDRTDAVFVEAYERGAPTTLVFAQRYRTAPRFETIGNAAFVDEEEPLF
jgi:hypothetical protein